MIYNRREKIMVINVAAFAENSRVKNTLIDYTKIRNITLDRCYAMEGYAELPIMEKNKIYDRIRKEVEKEYFM